MSVYSEGTLTEIHRLECKIFSLLQFFKIFYLFFEPFDLFLLLSNLVRQFDTPNLLKLIDLFFITLDFQCHLLDFRIKGLHFLLEQIKPIFVRLFRRSWLRRRLLFF